MKKYYVAAGIVIGIILAMAGVARAATILFPSGGGTGWGFPGGLAAHSVLIGNGLNPLATTSPGSAGWVLTSNGAAADPTFQASSAAGVTTVTATYPIASSGGTAPNISTAFGTTTNNVYSGTNTFNNGATTTSLSIGSLSGFLKATAGVISTALINLASDVTGVLPIANGGTASSTALGGILAGNGTSAIKSVVIGSNLTFDGTTLSATGGGGSGTVSTSSSETAGYFPTWATTNGTPALLAGTSQLFQSGVNIGVGSSSPGYPLSVAGPGWFTNSGRATIFGINTSQTEASGVNAGDMGIVSFASSTVTVRAAAFTAAYDGPGGNVNAQGLNAFATLDASATGNITSAGTNGGSLRNRYAAINNSNGYNVFYSSGVSGQSRVVGVLASTTNAVAFNAEAPFVSTGNLITNAYGLHVLTAAVTGTLVNNYGVYIDPLLAGTNQRYAFVQGGANDLNFFNGGVGIGATSTRAKLEVMGTTTTSAGHALTLWNSAAANIFDVDDSGTTTASNGFNISSGCYAIAGICLGSSSGVSSVSGTYPIISSGGATPAISLAFGTTTSNIWGGTQTFSNPIVIGALSGTLNSSAGVVYATATSTPTLSSELSYSGTLGSFIGGSSGAVSLTTNGTAFSKLVQIGANTILGNNTGATGNVVAFATSTLGIAISDTTGTLGIARGGTATTTGGFTNGVEYFNGTTLTNSGIFNFDGTKLGIGTTTPGATFAVGGNALISGTITAANFIDSSLTGNNCIGESSGVIGQSTNCVSSLASAGGTLTVSSPTGNVDVSINVAHSNIWSALQQFAFASSTIESVFKTAYFGGTATTTINADGIGSITMAANSIFKLGTTTAGTLAVSSTGVVYATSGATNFFTNSGNSTSLTTGINLGIGTTTPDGRLSVQMNYGETNQTLFSGASSTASNGSTAARIFNFVSAANGFLAYLGFGTTSPMATISAVAPASATMIASSSMYTTAGTYTVTVAANSQIKVTVIGGGGACDFGGTGNSGGGAIVATTTLTNHQAGGSFTIHVANHGSSTGGGSGYKTGGNGDTTSNFGSGGGGSSDFNAEVIAAGGGGCGNGHSGNDATGTSGGAGGAGNSNGAGGGGGAGTNGSNGSGGGAGAGGTGASSLTSVQSLGGGYGEGATTGNSPALGGYVFIEVDSFVNAAIPTTGWFEWFGGANAGIQYAVVRSVDWLGEIFTGGPSPTCGAAGCTSVSGDQTNIRILSSGGTTINVNYGTSWRNKSPDCVPHLADTGSVIALEASTTLSGVTITAASSLGANRWIGLHCEASWNFTF